MGLCRRLTTRRPRGGSLNPNLVRGLNRTALARGLPPLVRHGDGLSPRVTAAWVRAMIPGVSSSVEARKLLLAEEATNSDARDMLNQAVAPIARWLEGQFGRAAASQDGCGRYASQSDEVSIQIHEVLGIEVMVRSPVWGLLGFVDAAVAIREGSTAGRTE